MKFSNAQVLVELERIRLRQIPWHKATAMFNALSGLGLVTPVCRQVLGDGSRPTVDIAVLTDKGRVELDLLKRHVEQGQSELMALYKGSGGCSHSEE